MITIEDKTICKDLHNSVTRSQGVRAISATVARRSDLITALSVSEWSPWAAHLPSFQSLQDTHEARVRFDLKADVRCTDIH